MKKERLKIIRDKFYLCIMEIKLPQLKQRIKLKL